MFFDNRNSSFCLQGDTDMEPKLNSGVRGSRVDFDLRNSLLATICILLAMRW